MERRLNLLKNENGYTLIIVIMVLFVISILGLALMGTSATTLKQSDNERIDQATYYIAEAGLVQKKEEINFDKISKQAYSDTLSDYDTYLKNKEAKVNNIGDFNPNTVFLNHIEQYINSFEGSKEYDNFEKNFGMQPKSKVTFLKTNRTEKSLTYNISSIGSIGSRKSRNLVQNYTIGLKNELEFNNKIITNYTTPFSLHVDGGIIQKGNPDVDSSTFATTLPKKEFFDQSEGKFKDEIDKVNFEQKLPQIPEFPLSEFNVTNNANYRDCKNQDICTFPDKSIFNNINLINRTISIDVGDKDKIILVNNITLVNSNFIINKIENGKGKLRIYIAGSIRLDSNSSINGISKDVSQLFMYYNGNNYSNIDGAIYGSFDTGSYNFSDNKVLKDNISKIKGNMYTRYTGDMAFNHENEINFPQILFAPNASIELNGSSFYGAIISRSFRGNGSPSMVNFSKLAPIEVVETNLLPSKESDNFVLIEPILEK